MRLVQTGYAARDGDILTLTPIRAPSGRLPRSFDPSVAARPRPWRRLKRQPDHQFEAARGTSPTRCSFNETGSEDLGDLSESRQLAVSNSDACRA